MNMTPTTADHIADEAAHDAALLADAVGERDREQVRDILGPLSRTGLAAVAIALADPDRAEVRQP